MGSLAVAVLAAGCSTSSTGTSNAGRVLLVGTYRGHRGPYLSIQSAVAAAKSGTWVLVAPGDYHELYDHTVPVGRKPLSGVYLSTPGVHLRGMDRNAVVVDGTKPGAPQCSAAQRDQDFGPTDATAKPVGRNGIEVWKADGTSVENLTVCNFMTGSEGGGNQVWWNGGDGSGTTGLGAYNGSYLSTTTSYFGKDGEGEYGIFVSNSAGPGQISHTYASNMADSDYYVGACQDCNVVIDDAHAQHSALGYSGTNAGGHLIIQNSEFDDNKLGLAPNSLNNDDAPSPQDGACPNTGTGPTGTRSCTVFENNSIHDNNNPNVPTSGVAGFGPTGTGLIVAGGRNDVITNNRFENNGAWGVLIVPYPDTSTPPPVAHCVGGDPNGLPSIGLKGCYYGAWGNEIAGNTFKANGAFANPTNGDLADLSDVHNPGNCWHDNINPAGVTSAPSRLQQTNGTCGVAQGGAKVIGSDLSNQVLCAAEVFSPCPPKPGMAYPRASRVTLSPLPRQPTMPNPCNGVPANPWCSKHGPVSSSALLLPVLVGPAAALSRRHHRRR
jgi:hypothetical protein